MALNIENIIAEIKEASILELNDLVKAIEEEFGVTAAAPVAVAAAAPAAIGAFSENAENFGKSLIFVALGEGVAIYGLLISILIINTL